MYFKNTPTSILIRTLPRHIVYLAAAAAYFTRLGLLGTFLSAKAGSIGGFAKVRAKRAAIQRARRASADDIWRQLEPHWLRLKLAEEKFDLSIAKGRSRTRGPIEGTASSGRDGA
jgi:hypothetical protein